MSRRFWGLLVSSAVVLALVLAVVQPGGPSGQESFAHEITTTPNYMSTPSNEGPALHLELDMNVTNGSGPCDPVDARAEHGYNDRYQVAVCVTGLREKFPVRGFSLDIVYDDTLNKAPEVADIRPALDDNPDANAGDNTWGDGLGAGWDCSAQMVPPGGEAYPEGDMDPASGPNHGDAFITCSSSSGDLRLGDGETAGVLALITFEAQGVAGTDTLTIADGLLRRVEFGTSSCVQSGEYDLIPCFGGTDIKVEPHKRKTPIPTATATATATPVPTEVPSTPIISPTPTPTMFGGPGGIVVGLPRTGSGPSGGGSPQTVWLFALAGAAGAAAAVDGFRRFARRSRT